MPKPIRSSSPPGAPVTSVAHATTVLAPEQALAHLSKATRERLATVGLRAAEITHQLATPLTVILGTLQLLRLTSGATAPNGLGPVLEKIQANADEIAWVVKEFWRLLNGGLSPHGLVRQTPADLTAIVQGAVQQALEATQARERVTLDEAYGLVPTVLVDARWLRQALVNVVKNAVEAMPEGGALTIRTGWRQDGGIEILVGDTGHGMDQPELQRLFRPLHSRKGPGSLGLGLALSQEIIAAHRGWLEVTSVKGTGTTVLIVLSTDGDLPVTQGPPR